jgi:hypothetical protein
MLRTSGTPLRAIWSLAYRAIARVGARYIAAGCRGSTTYVRASFASRDFVPGLSDVDLTLVLPHDPGGTARARSYDRWLRVRRSLPVVDLVLDYPRIYDERELKVLARDSAYTFGLDRAEGPRAGYFGLAAGADGSRLLERPGLYGPTTDWRRLHGPERRPFPQRRGRQAERIAAWLELAYWWQWVFPVCLDPSGPRTPHLCVKLVAEPARVWLWLAHAERVPGRGEALRRALDRLPEEEEALRGALALQSSLSTLPRPPLEESVAALARMSARIAALIAAELEEHGTSEVRLTGGEPGTLLPEWETQGQFPQETRLPAAGAFPLTDWRALAFGRGPDETFELLPGDPAQPGALAAAARREGGPYGALAGDGFLVLPSTQWWRTRLRAIKCPATDPVSFALVAGRDVARFPQVPGWSVADTARRAVSEHMEWLRGYGDPSVAADRLQGWGPLLALLLCAARAGLLRSSLDEGEPALALTAAETARGLAPYAAGIADEGFGHYREYALHRTPPPDEVVRALRDTVLGLPAYRVEG